jgi:hypothetical protein
MKIIVLECNALQSGRKLTTFRNNLLQSTSKMYAKYSSETLVNFRDYSDTYPRRY